MYPWRAMNDEVEVCDMLVEKRRSKTAATLPVQAPHALRLTQPAYYLFRRQPIPVPDMPPSSAKPIRFAATRLGDRSRPKLRPARPSCSTVGEWPFFVDPDFWRQAQNAFRDDVAENLVRAALDARRWRTQQHRLKARHIGRQGGID